MDTMESQPVSHVITPGTKRIDLGHGEWLIVKRELNAGETMDLFEVAADGQIVTNPSQLKPTKIGPAMIVAYLLDWNQIGPDGAPIEIRNLDADDVTAALRRLSFEKFSEIMNAIVAYDAALRQEKKRHTSAAATGSSEPSTSRVAAGGVMNG